MSDLEKRRTLAYIRVSTEHQDLDRQRDMIRRYCLANDITVDRWLEDDGISGRATAMKGRKKASGADMAYYAALCLDDYLAHIERPGFLTLLQSVKDGGYRRLLVGSLDRLSRDMTELSIVARKLEQWDCELVAIDGGTAIRIDNANGFVMFAIKAMFAEFEVRTTQDRTVQGIAAKRAMGQQWGRPPVGWTVAESGDGYRPDPAAWPRVTMAAAMREAGATLEEIAGRVGVKSKPAAKRLLESWERRHEDGFHTSAEDLRLPKVDDLRTLLPGAGA